MDTTGVTHLTFDCYGTIIDWETGLLTALRELAGGVDDGALLEAYARHESAVEAGAFRRYREVLGLVEGAVAAEFGVESPPTGSGRLAASLADWPPFDDSIAALRRLGERFRLVIVSNVDDDLFEGSRALLPGVSFADVVTAEQVGAYKPSHRNFHVALERMGVGPDRVIHVAQSVYHDHVPAAELGIRSVWVNRPSILAGRGITPETELKPAVEAPDLASVVDLLI